MGLKRLCSQLIFRPAGAPGFSTSYAWLALAAASRLLASDRIPLSVSGQGSSCLGRQGIVGFGAAVAEKLPDLPYFRNHVEVEIGD